MTKPKKETYGLKRLSAFVLIALTTLAISFFTPVRDHLTVASIQQLANDLGSWGPTILLVFGAMGPQFFLPRWPVCFVAGLLYGVVWGTVLANFICVMGAWLHYLSGRALLSTASKNLLRKANIDPAKIAPNRSFLVIFLLRAFPLTNSAATNVLAGALKMSMWSYVAATFLGMIPSTLMYAAWGKLLKKPSSHFYLIALVTLLLIALGTVVAKTYLFPLLTNSRNGSGDEKAETQPA